MENKQRLINATELAEKVYNSTTYIVGRQNGKTLITEWLEKYRNEVLRMICKAPTVDAVPVVHGRWVWDIEIHGDPMYCIDEDYGYRCSECKVWADEYGVDGDIYEEPPTNTLHYCPNCGAKMDG